MQEFALLIAAIVAVALIVVLSVAGPSLLRLPRQIAIGLIVGLLAAVLVLAPREDILPDQFQDVAQIVLIVAVTGAILLLGLRRRRLG